MKAKLFFVFGFLVLGLTSCNLPFQNSEPDPLQVATHVAETFSAIQTQTIPASATPTLETILPTVTPTQMEPTVTETATLTATTPPDDPAITLGKPDFFDTFNSGTSFGLGTPYDDDAVQIKVADGVMSFTSYIVRGGKRWRLTSRNPVNLYLEGKFNPVICDGYDQYGLVFRAPTYGDGKGYYFGITCNGQYYFQRWDSTGVVDLVDLTEDFNIRTGNNQENRIGVKADGSDFKLYINGILVKEVSDSGLTARGYIGAFVSAYENPGFTVNLQEISLWSLP